MAICPFARQELLTPENQVQPHIVPRTVVLHSVSGYGDQYGFFEHSSNLESHFWVGLDGTIAQYMDTNVKADANLKANAFAVSIETESSVAATEPWSPAQVDSIVKLVDWVCRTHNVPRVQCPAWDAAGIGWHVMWGAPGPWTPVSKSCPGPARIEQVKSTIIPRVAALGGAPQPQEPDVTPAECQQMIDAAVAKAKVEIAAYVNQKGAEFQKAAELDAAAYVNKTLASKGIK